MINFISFEFNLAKRRTANHPCPVCGKHYVNEGSLRKHLACHPETSQLTTSLRMWPCSVCQAVFTHESGLLTHMEHMRMDPKHQVYLIAMNEMILLMCSIWNIFKNSLLPNMFYHVLQLNAENGIRC